MTNTTIEETKVKKPRAKKEKINIEQYKTADAIRCKINGSETIGLIYLSEYANMKIYYVIHNNEATNTHGLLPWEIKDKNIPEKATFKYGWKISEINEDINFEKFGVTEAKKIEKVTNGESLTMYGLR